MVEFREVLEYDLDDLAPLKEGLEALLAIKRQVYEKHQRLLEERAAEKSAEQKRREEILRLIEDDKARRKDKVWIS